MLKRSNPWLLGSLGFALLYPFAGIVGLSAPMEIAVKGSAVGLLAAAALRAVGVSNHRQLALILALGAVGDMVLEIHFMAGVAAFASGHAAAIHLYVRNRRETVGWPNWAFAGLLPVIGLTMPLLILGWNDPAILPLALYSLLLTTMAALAWISRYERALTGLGALLFVASDTLIAVRMSQGGGTLIGLAIWWSYYAGQLLIYLGVMRAPSGARI